mgnify:CR=1 FL=1
MVRKNFIKIGVIIFFSWNFIYPQMRWEHQTGGWIKRIYFHNSTGYIGISREKGGIIKKSIDGGDTWDNILIFGGGNSYGQGVMFSSDSSHVVVFGTIPQGNVIFITKNGGETWDTILISGISYPNDMFFIDSLNGWMVGGHKRVYRTQDGGYTWQLLSSGGDTSFTHVEFLNQNIGFVRGTRGFNFDRLFKTTDGGYNWYVLSFPSTNIYFFDFVDELNGYVIASIWENYEKIRIYKTSDGGTNWLIFYEFPSNFKPKCMSVKNLNEIWIGGQYMGFRAQIYHYKNGNWYIWTDNFSSSEPITAICEINSNMAVAGGYYGTIFKTIDGVNFEEITAGIPLSPSVKAIDTLNIWAVGGGYIINSKNSGKTWHRKQPFDYNGIFTDIEFIDTLNGWVADTFNKRILYTHNGGNTWGFTEISLPSSKLSFINSQKGWACGGIFYPSGMDGWVYRTQDGGQTWQLIYQTNQPAITDIIFVDSLNGWIVGGQYDYTGPWYAFISKTTNGGYSWSVQYFEFYKDAFNCVEFVNQNFGWVGASVLPPSFRTINGGSTWFPIDSIVNVFSFLNENYGWGIKRLENSFCPAYTLNGGETWTEMREGIIPSNIYFSSIDVIDFKNGCWVGVSDEYGGAYIYRFYGDFTTNAKESSRFKISLIFPMSNFIKNKKIKFFLYEKEMIKFTLMDINGRVVFDIPEKYFNKGLNLLDLSKINLSPNLYFLKIKTSKREIYEKIIFLKD